MKSSRILVVIIVLQSMAILSLWTGSHVATPVYAQIPDAGGQRIQIIDELKTLNGKMDKLIEVIEGGKVQVKVAASDDKKE